MSSNVNGLYHWTHRDNLTSIARYGLDPSRATGELFAVWGCKRGRVDWARDHVASRHRWNPDDLVLLRVTVRHKRVYRTCWKDVFYTPELIVPECIEVVEAERVFTPIASALDTTRQHTPA